MIRTGSVSLVGWRRVLQGKLRPIAVSESYPEEELSRADVHNESGQCGALIGHPYMCPLWMQRRSQATLR